PGYSELMEWVDATIMPTPGAVGTIIQVVAREDKVNIVGVDIGGATTDVFSDFGGTFTRTVSANLGMSYSITNVYEEASFENVRRWVPFPIDEAQFADWVSNKMVRPTAIPQTVEHLILEQALAREALRLSFDHHKRLAKKVEAEQKGLGSSSLGEVRRAEGVDIIKMNQLDMLLGSGGVLSHAPRRQQAALMLLDAFQPEGITQLAVDSVFMTPHLGVLASVHPDIAAEVFRRDCLVPLGTSVAVSGKGKDGRPACQVKVAGPGGSETFWLYYGELRRLPLGWGEEAEIELIPERGIDVGAGPGKPRQARVKGGVVGLIFDGRGRPIELPSQEAQRRARLLEWLQALDVYPQEALEALQGEEGPQEGSQEGRKSRGFRLFGRRASS
ncbi:MAG: glutamate mutase L, partial [Bacillota bacterium]|nr:glutamate mutase L [Bacillota bacterium]